MGTNHKIHDILSFIILSRYSITHHRRATPPTTDPPLQLRRHHRTLVPPHHEPKAVTHPSVYIPSCHYSTIVVAYNKWVKIR
ncbi:hypothetical protein L484_011775 [Morus notabilis]|uniref:Uncharacterized protein n=1 Tax=Morus notabilis TaxID=981085 RepID=W9SEB3_9ROSA|nr:hypothetical protein L484_011775 [Morus notabilis]